MKPGAPWNIEEIDDEIRQVARLAARGSGPFSAGRPTASPLQETASDETEVCQGDRRTPDQDSGAEADGLASPVFSGHEHANASLLNLHGRLEEIVKCLGAPAGTGRQHDGEGADAELAAEVVSPALPDVDDVFLAGSLSCGEAKASEAAGTSEPTRPGAVPSDASSVTLEAIQAHLETLLAAAPPSRPTTAFNTPVRAVLGPRAAAADGGSCASRLDAIETEIAAIRSALERSERPRSIARIEMQLAGLADAVEAGSASANAANLLESRVDAILKPLDGIVEGIVAPGGRDQIKAEIAQLTCDIAEQHLARVAKIEAEVAKLGQRLTGADLLNRSDPQVRALEARVSCSSSQFKAAESRTVIDIIRSALRRLKSPPKVGRHERMHLRPLAFRALPPISIDDGNEGRGFGPTSASRTCPARADLEGIAEPPVVPRSCTMALSGDRPSKSGVPKSDIAALHELTKSVRRPSREATSDRKASFIAVARHATKTIAEGKPGRDRTAPADRRLGAIDRIGRAISNRRRTFLASAAAATLVVCYVLVSDDVDTSTELSSESATSAATGAESVSVATGPVRPASGSAQAAGEPAPTPSGLTKLAFAAPGVLATRFGQVPLAPSSRGFAHAYPRSASLPLDDDIGPPDLREAAAAGDPNAALEVAARYAEGRIVSRDFAKSAQWYELAAEDGVAMAQHRLASLYEQGRGVAQDRALAAAWYRRAADQGVAGAMHNLAVLISEGIEGASNKDEAVDWYRAAARYGVRDSQYNLGIIYAQGIGRDRDLVESYTWFALAAADGDAEARTRRDEIAAALSPGELLTAQTAVKAWRAAPVVAEATAEALPPNSSSDANSGIAAVDRNALVVKIQTLLAEQGYDPGPADGLEGPQTREAVRAFQRRIGVADTGVISRDLVAVLADRS